MRFKDQVVVITGAAKGIGLHAAQLFAAEGATVAVNDLDAGAVEAAVDEIRMRGGRALAIPGDVSDYDQVQANVRRVLEQAAAIDVLVNNAGLFSLDMARRVSPQAWRRVMAVNLDGVFYWSQAVAVGSMIPRRRGAIVNVASVAGMVAVPDAASYVASKHGVVGLTKALAVEWGQHNIRVNAVCPGLTWTDMPRAAQLQNPRMYEERERRIPLGRAATTLDQARAILYLASSEAESVHGLIMNVDGGNVAMSSGSSVSIDSMQ